MKVFLGGTCNNSQWRETLIPMLQIDYFNPVVENWTPACQQRELDERASADFVLYVITPKMIGVYAIAEAVDDSNKRPEKTVFCVLGSDAGGEFLPAQRKSLDAVAAMINQNGGYATTSLEDVARYLNSWK